MKEFLTLHLSRTNADTTPQRKCKEMEKRNDIYQGLKKHYGAFRQLAEKCAVSERWVLMVLSGKHQDEDLLLAAAKLWHELEKQKKAKLEEADRFAEMAAALTLA